MPVTRVLSWSYSRCPDAILGGLLTSEPNSDLPAMTYAAFPSPAVLLPDARAQAIANTALMLHRSHPQAPALEVLDLSMVAYQDSAFPDFDAPGMSPSNSAFLPSPFASLLRAAFAPNWTDEDFAAPASDAPGAAASTHSQMWALQVLAEFADRYGLTQAREQWRYTF